MTASCRGSLIAQGRESSYLSGRAFAAPATALGEKMCRGPAHSCTEEKAAFVLALALPELASDPGSAPLTSSKPSCQVPPGSLHFSPCPFYLSYASHYHFGCDVWSSLLLAFPMSTLVTSSLVPPQQAGYKINLIRFHCFLMFSKIMCRLLSRAQKPIQLYVSHSLLWSHAPFSSSLTKSPSCPESLCSSSPSPFLIPPFTWQALTNFNRPSAVPPEVCHRFPTPGHSSSHFLFVTLISNALNNPFTKLCV